MSMYGYFEGRESRTHDPSDPIDVVLGTCRMLGLLYDVRKSPYPSSDGSARWTVSLSINDWPADFYSHTPPRSPRRMVNQLTVVNVEESGIRFALQQCISAAFGNLRDSCEHWRRIAASHPDYRSWPQFSDPQDKAVPTNKEARDE